jgi:hypothetical protein
VLTPRRHFKDAHENSKMIIYETASLCSNLWCPFTVLGIIISLHSCLKILHLSSEKIKLYLHNQWFWHGWPATSFHISLRPLNSILICESTVSTCTYSRKLLKSSVNSTCTRKLLKEFSKHTCTCSRKMRSSKRKLQRRAPSRFRRNACGIFDSSLILLHGLP